MSNEKKLSLWESSNYIVLGLFVTAQLVVGINFLLGEALFFMGDIIVIARDFALRRPSSDKVKNIAMTALLIIAVALFLIKQ